MQVNTLIVMGVVVLAAAVVWPGRVIEAQSSRSIWTGVYTDDQAVRGDVLYQTWCAECHGGALEGGETAPGLIGGEFMWAWHGLSLGDLFERLRISMPEGNPGEMSRDEKADVLAFMLSRNGVPAGDVELESRTAPLRGISFEAVKPQ